MLLSRTLLLLYLINLTCALQFGVWTKLVQLGDSPLPRGTWDPTTDGNDIWTFGGLVDDFNGNLTFYNDLYKAKVVGPVAFWDKVVPKSAAKPTVRAFFETEIDGDYLYLFGGGTHAVGGFPFFPAEDVFWRFDLSTKKWQSLPSAPVARMSPLLGVHDDNLYIFGGIALPGILLSDFWKYNIPTGQWQQINFTYGPVARVSPIGGIIERNGQAGFLVYGGSNIVSDLLDVWFYDFAANTWLNLTTSEVIARQSTSAAIVNGDTMYIPFGEEFPLNQTGCGAPRPLNPVSSTIRFDVDENDWKILPVLNQPIGYKRVGTAVIGDSVYVLGGYGFQCPGQGQIWNADIHKLIIVDLE